MIIFLDKKKEDKKIHRDYLPFNTGISSLYAGLFALVALVYIFKIFY